MSRYEQLLQIIDLFKPQTIVETGVWNGHNAIRMIKQAQKHNRDVLYNGYDLFEEATPETDAIEFNVKKHNTLNEVFSLIHQETNANVHLHIGDTNKTLKPTSADLAFIDGGHSIPTIKNDFVRLQSSAIIVLDDYYTLDEEGNCPDTKLYGCNQLVCWLDHVVLPMKDPVKGGGYTQFVMVIGG